jgi:hypothetical protein
MIGMWASSVPLTTPKHREFGAFYVDLDQVWQAKSSAFCIDRRRHDLDDAPVGIHGSVGWLTPLEHGSG